MGEKVNKIRAKSYNFFQRIKRFSLLLYYKVLRIQATPEAISRGLASGVFIGMLPLLPVQTPCAILLAYLMKGSKLAAALGTWVSNPLNWVPLYLAFYHIGKKVFHFVNAEILGNMNLPFNVPRLDLDHVTFMELLHKGPKMLLIMFIGALTIAIPSALISYNISLKSITLYQKRKKARLLKRIKKIEEEAIKKMHEEHNNIHFITKNETSHEIEKKAEK